MNWKTIVAAFGAAIVTFLVTYFLTAGQEVVEAGMDAQIKEQIRTVLREEMVVDINGETKTYGQVLSILHTKVTANEAILGVLVEE